jgi:Tol biopolymer transport system component
MTRSAVLAFVLATSAAAQPYGNLRITIHPIAAVNSAANDYAPVLAADRQTLYLTSYRGDGSLGEADLFRARRSGDDWAAAEDAGAPFNTRENDGALAIAADGVTVAFAADDRPDGLGDTDILFARLDGGTLESIRNPGAPLNSSSWDSQPALSGDGKTIVFASNRPGGTGGTDLWTGTIDQWGTVTNVHPLPAHINTRGNECAPYLTPDGGTLYYASDGLSGYGGYDIWMTTFANGAWTQPVNLGPTINSAADEMFFVAPGKNREFFFASSRPGGKGGLDIYAGSPNLFGSGTFRLAVSVLDSASGRPLPSAVSVVDAETGDIVAELTTNAKVDEYGVSLPAGRAYRVEARIRDLPPRTVTVPEAPANGEQHARILFGSITVADFDLGKYNVPFFVTGYYRPNTKQNLQALYGLLDGPLSAATYIERFRENSQRAQQYETYAETVESIFRTVYTAGTDEIFPHFALQALPSEILQITVTGYADPQPIVGKYLEDDDVQFVDGDGRSHTVSKGDRMDNLMLSGLRAWYSGRYLDALFASAATEGHREYSDLKSAGRIKYVYVGGNVSNDNTDFAAQRRIRITMTRIGGDTESREVRTDFDLDKNVR